MCLGLGMMYLPRTISSVASPQSSTPPMWLVELVGEVGGMEGAGAVGVKELAV
jgi:hypothetical protein